MQDNLVIVESPAKAKTIEKILGPDFLVKSSFGHIRDLAKTGISIDIENGFEPKYEVSPDKKEVVNELKKLSKQASQVWLASDEDREGEAIAWHLQEALSLDPSKTKRIVFHEITPSAIKAAVENPRSIDQNLVDAQQARRVLDRLVGFELSPLLWRKVRPSLSAGRVQSVAVKLIVEKEREILDFESAGYYRVIAEFLTAAGEPFRGELKDRIPSLEQAEKFLQTIIGASYKVSNVETNPASRTPAAPFTTSTLQQEASRKLSFSVSQTMSVAQKLYEKGYITYMRTDSVNLSGFAIGAAAAAIKDIFGAEYHKSRNYTTKSKGAQEAHEAIRPTNFAKASISGTEQEKRLYDLIWRRTVATQMADAKLEKTTAHIAISTSDKKFTAQGEVILFDGFLKLYMESLDDDNANGSGKQNIPPAMAAGEAVTEQSITATERFTQRPARYSEASLVKQLEELGIGRPSTYAPTISTIINRGYVVKESRDGQKREYKILTLNKGKIATASKTEVTGTEKNKLFPTDIGMVVTDFLQQHFASILDYNFTAKVEKEFDEIAEGAMVWREMLEKFYGPFHKNVVHTETDSDYARADRLIGVDPATGKNIYGRIGRFGPMVQMGESEETSGEKPRFASLQKGQLIVSITLDEALQLFSLPRNLGQYEGKDVVIGIGKFGPYARHDSKFTSLGKTDNPYTVTLERTIEIIEAKREAERNKVIQVFETEPVIQILNGRWGPYITSDGKNYKIPKGTDAAALTLEQSQELVAKGDREGTASVPRFAKSAAAKKSASKTTVKSKKTTTAKKTAAKKPAAKKKVAKA